MEAFETWLYEDTLPQRTQLVVNKLKSQQSTLFQLFDFNQRKTIGVGVLAKRQRLMNAQQQVRGVKRDRGDYEQDTG